MMRRRALATKTSAADDNEDDVAGTTRLPIAKMQVPQLREELRGLGISFGRMRKAELMDLLQKARDGDDNDDVGDADGGTSSSSSAGAGAAAAAAAAASEGVKEVKESFMSARSLSFFLDSFEYKSHPS